MEEQLAGHAQRHDQRLAAVEVEDDELPAPPYPGDPPAAQPRGDVLRRHRLRQAHPERFEGFDGAADHELAQLPRDGLDLGELRHRRYTAAATSRRCISSQFGPARTSTTSGTSSR